MRARDRVSTYFSYPAALWERAQPLLGIYLKRCSVASYNAGTLSLASLVSRARESRNQHLTSSEAPLELPLSPVPEAA